MIIDDHFDRGVPPGHPHPALAHPGVAAIIRLARKHRPEDFKKLWRTLDQLGFSGRRWEAAVTNVPEESAYRWLAWPYRDCARLAYDGAKADGYLQCLGIRDELTELLRKALHLGEVRPIIDGPDALMIDIEFRGGEKLRVARLVFAEDDGVKQEQAEDDASTEDPAPNPERPPFGKYPCLDKWMERFANGRKLKREVYEKGAMDLLGVTQKEARAAYAHVDDGLKFHQGERETTRPNR
jgi:hypothetical protein